MRFCLLAALSATFLAAQSSSPPASTLTAAEKDRAELSRVNALVKEGAIARNRLDEMQRKIDDAGDAATLKRTLFGNMSVEDLNEVQIGEMLQAARRRVERILPRIESLRKMIDDGIVARRELDPELEELAMREQTLELATGRAKSFEQLLALIRAEEEAVLRAEDAREKAETFRAWERFDGSALFTLNSLAGIQTAYQKFWRSSLPVSALGDTELHRSMGYDHRDRVDVALTPDSPEGRWLRQYLETRRIPYFAFRSFIPGSATGAHIHIGRPSLRFQREISGN